MRLQAPERADGRSSGGEEEPLETVVVRRRADRHRRSRRERRRERRSLVEAAPSPSPETDEWLDPAPLEVDSAERAVADLSGSIAASPPPVEGPAPEQPALEVAPPFPELPPPPAVAVPTPAWGLPALPGPPLPATPVAVLAADVAPTVEDLPTVTGGLPTVGDDTKAGFVPDVWTELGPPERRYEARPRRARRRRRRARGLLTVTTLVVVVAVVAAAVGVHVLRSRHRQAPVSVDALPPSSLAWAVSDGRDTFVTILAVRGGRAPMAVVIPGGTAVDLPGGGAPTVGEAASSGPEALAAAQAVVDRRIGHFLWMSQQDLSGLVDALGGVNVQTEAAFTYSGQTLGPGPVQLNGAQAVAYLQESSGTDATGRWEDVLAALLARSGSQAMPAITGQSDDPASVARLLTGATGAPVTELSVAQETLGLVPDPKALARLQGSLGNSVGPLIRVVVENGSGVPGLGDAVQQLLAPRGFRVVASQNLPKFDVAHTSILAANDSFVPWANAAQRLLGAGKVYVGQQATGIADLTIIVGKDFRAG